MNEKRERHLRFEIYNPPECFLAEGFTVGKSYTILNEKSDLNSPFGMSYTVRDDMGNMRTINSNSFECKTTKLRYDDEYLPLGDSECDINLREIKEKKKSGWDGLGEEKSYGRTFRKIEGDDVTFLKEEIVLLREKVAKAHRHDEAAVLAGIINYNQDTLFDVIEKELENIDDCLARIECSQSTIKQKLQYIKNLAVAR